MLTSNAGVELAYVPYALIYFKSFIKVGGAKNEWELEVNSVPLPKI